MVNELVEKAAERFFGEVAGFTWALFIVLALCAILGAEGLVTPVLALILTGLCYWSGKILDPFFDRIYGPGRDYASSNGKTPPDNSRVTVANAILSAEEFKPKKPVTPNPTPIPLPFFFGHFGRDALNDKRESAANELFLFKFPHAGLYSCCKQLLQPTELWSKHIESWLQLSKFARTFAALFFFLVLADLINPDWIEWLKQELGGETHASTLQDAPLSAWVSERVSRLVATALSTWPIAVFLCLIALIVSVGARFKRMSELYLRAADASWVQMMPLQAAGSGSAGDSRAPHREGVAT
jgi:hypothetical protein